MKHYVGIAFLIVVVAFIALFFLRECEQSTSRTLARVNKTFSSVLRLQPEVRINQTVVYSQTSPLAELAVVTKEQTVDYTYKQHEQLLGYKIPMTDKTILAHGMYRLKAGFNLKKPFIVNIDNKTGEIQAALSPAEILSVELIGSPQMTDESGLLNPVTGEERQQVLDGLTSTARNAAENSGLTKEAEEQILDRLKEISEKNGEKIIFQWTNKKAD